MSIAAPRSKSPAPAQAPKDHVQQVVALLQSHTPGLSWDALVSKAALPPKALANALSVALDAREVAIVSVGEAPCYGSLVLEGHTEPDRALVDQVMNFITAYAAGEREGDDSTIELKGLVALLSSTHSEREVLEALQVLRQEKIARYQVLLTNSVQVTLSSSQWFTVVGCDTNVHQPLCFYVRAGTAEVAFEKIRDCAYYDEELALYGITRGAIGFSKLSGYSGMMEVTL